MITAPSAAFDLTARLAGLATEMAPRAVAHTSELDRILALPRRVWREDDPRIIRLTFEMSDWLRLPGSTATLRPIQAIALCELYYLRRLFAPMPVGSGKTLVTFLAPTVMNLQRPILILPAKLRDVKTPRDFARYAKDWRAPCAPPGTNEPRMFLLSYETLSRDYGDERVVVYNEYGQVLPGMASPLLWDAFERQGRAAIHATYDPEKQIWDAPRLGGPPIAARVLLQLQSFGILDTFNPDGIIDDEVHRFKNLRAACTRKMRNFMDSHPDVPHVDLSGTITNDSIMNYAHILDWTHRSDTPIPRHYNQRKEWANAIDATVADEDRVEVGALVELATPEERRALDPTTAARRGFRARLVQTPGVVAYAKRYAGSSLFIRETPPIDYDPVTEEHFARLRADGKLPNDETTRGGLEDWRHARTLALGFFQTFDPPPPEPWRNARVEWHAAARYIHNENQKGLDSLFQIARACADETPGALRKYRGEMWDEGRRAYRVWKEVEPSFIPNPVITWIDDSALRSVAKWMKKNKGLVWVDHIEFAERLSEMTDAPYFHQGGLDASGRSVEDARPARDGSIIVSLEAVKDGFNLQAYAENLYTSVPKGPVNMEQSMGRTDRPGQLADEITYDVMITCREEGDAWLAVLEKSRYVEDTTTPMKVLYADLAMPDTAELLTRGAHTARFV